MNGIHRTLATLATLVGIMSAGLAVSGAPAHAADSDYRFDVSDALSGGVLEGDSGTTMMVFEVTLSSPTGRWALWGDADVSYRTLAEGATADVDYTPVSGRLTFDGDDLPETQQIAVPVHGDTEIEGLEFLGIELFDPDDAVIGDGQGGGIISYDDYPRAYVGNGRTVTEGDAGERTMSFVVRLDQAAPFSTTAYLSTTNAGTASAPTDFDAITSQRMTFASGETQKSFDVRINGDSTLEPNESVQVSLQPSSNLEVGDASAVGWIRNDDTPSVRIHDTSAVELSYATKALFTVSLSEVVSHDVRVSYDTRSGTATEWSDFMGTSGTLTIPAGKQTAQIEVWINPDKHNERTESFFVDLTDVASFTPQDGDANGNRAIPGAAITDSSGRGLIYD